MQDDWQYFLEQQSANINDSIVPDFGDPVEEQAFALSDNTMTDLSHLDVLKISGQNAGSFLHGQFSSDVACLAERELQMSSWCNIKGRVIASFILYRSRDCFYLLLERNISEMVSKRLQMFVMRSDVSISNQSDDLIRIGIRGESTHEQLDLVSNIEHTLLPMPDSIPRSIILVRMQHAPTLWTALSAHTFCIANYHWSNYDILAGIAWVGKEGSEEFLPQSLNLDLIGGLSFEKGCYPGQEIIARMHFRGKLKQRLFLARVFIPEPPPVKTKLLTPGVSKHVGMVVNTYMQKEDGCLMLVVLDLELGEQPPITLGEDKGPVLKLESLPYSLRS